MLKHETAVRLALTFAVLRRLQQCGDAPPPGKVSTHYIAHLSREIGEPVAESTVRALEKAALKRARRLITDRLTPKN